MCRSMRFIGTWAMVSLLALVALGVTSSQCQASFTRQQAAEKILYEVKLMEGGEDLNEVSISMADTTYGYLAFAEDFAGVHSDYGFPYESTWFALVDFYPFAEWAHSCLWVFMDNYTGDIVSEERDFFPLLFDDESGMDIPLECIDPFGSYPELYPCDAFYDGLDAGVSPPPMPFPDELRGVDAECVYAVLVASGAPADRNGEHHKEDVEKFEKALTDYGVDASTNIKKHTSGATDEEIGNDIKHFCETVPLTKEDNLIIFIRCHGSPNSLHTKDSDNSNAGRLSATELKGHIGKCSKVCRVFTFIGACHSGSFIDDLNGCGNTITVTSAGASQTSYTGHTSTEKGGIWGMRIRKEVPGKSAPAIHAANDDEVNSIVEPQLIAKNALGCRKHPEKCKQNPQYGKSATVEHEGKNIAYCCEEETPVEQASWGTIKALYR